MGRIIDEVFGCYNGQFASPYTLLLARGLQDMLARRWRARTHDAPGSDCHVTSSPCRRRRSDPANPSEGSSSSCQKRGDHKGQCRPKVAGTAVLETECRLHLLAWYRQSTNNANSTAQEQQIASMKCGTLPSRALRSQIMHILRRCSPAISRQCEDPKSCIEVDLPK